MTLSVRISKPSNSAMQSSPSKNDKWVLEYELPTRRSPEALMGWVSSDDTLNQVKLEFDSQEEAQTFAKEKGWHATVIPARIKKIRPQNYGDNFKYTKPAEG